MLPIAAQDLDNIVEYLSQFYESWALDQYDRIVNKIRALPHFPEMCEAYEPGKYHYRYRRLTVDDYLVFYVVLDDSIEIHRILHGSRDIKLHLNDSV